MTVGTHVYKLALNNGRSSVQKPFMNHRQSTSLLLLFVKHYASSAKTAAAAARKRRSFAASYLVNTCGFSPESALSVSRYVKIKTAAMPDSVLSCLREYGFTETQSSNLVRRCPLLLSINPEKTLSPKFEFFLSKGVSRTELTKVFSSFPSILTRSLNKYMVPFYDFLTSVLKSDEKVTRVFVRCPRIIHSYENYVKVNINHLHDNGVPEAKIAFLVRIWPSTLSANTKRFNEIVGYVKEKGLKPENVSFVTAIAAVAAMSRPTWEKKVLLYEGWGWSKEDIFGAFQKHPQFMMTSEIKINAVMDLLINKIGCKPSYIAQHPMLISFSLEKRTIPRSSVIKVLLSKGMVKLTCLSPMLKISDDLFEKKLLTKYKEEALDLLKLYREKMNVPK